MGIRSGYLSVSASINLLGIFVRSILEYASSVWGFEYWPEGERIQLEMGRRILRSTKKTTNEAIVGDLGWWSLQGRRNLKKLLYWYEISYYYQNQGYLNRFITSVKHQKKKSWANR